MTLGPFTAIHGATAWEVQIFRVWIAVRHPRFWHTSGLGFVRITDRGGNWG